MTTKNMINSILKVQKPGNKCTLSSSVGLIWNNEGRAEAMGRLIW